MALNLGTAYSSIEIRLDKLEAGLAEAERRFSNTGKKIENEASRLRQKMQQQFGDIGRTLTVGLTLPLTALGTAAVKAAADMDSLKRGMNAVTGSAAETQRQMDRLKEVAALPGLSFQEAVRGSINLQAAGLSAKSAEGALKGFGNALATVGKGSADLSGVVLALTQIAAKGKVSAEEINQLQERVPQIRQLMKDAFGTADTEVLQKQGIASEQFIDKIIAQLEKLPRASGGIANAFENAKDSANRALVAIGDVMLPAVSKAVSFLADKLEAFAAAWKNVPPIFQMVAVGAAGVAASLGVVAVGISGVSKAVETLSPLFVRLGPLLTNPWVLGAAAVAALSVAIYALVNSTRDEEKSAIDAAQASRRNAEAKADAAQKAQVLYQEYEKLTEKTHLTKEEQTRLQKVLNELSVLSPEIVKAYDAQGNATALYTDALKKLTAEHIRQAEAAHMAMLEEKALNAQQIAGKSHALLAEREAIRERLRSGIDVAEHYLPPSGPGGMPTRIPAVQLTEARRAELNARLRQIQVELDQRENERRAALGFGVRKIGAPAPVAVDEELNRAGRLIHLQERLAAVKKELDKIEGQTFKTNAERNTAGARRIRLEQEEKRLNDEIEAYDPSKASAAARKAADKQRQIAETISQAEIAALNSVRDNALAKKVAAEQSADAEFTRRVSEDPGNQKLFNAAFAARASAYKAAQQEYDKAIAEATKRSAEEAKKAEENYKKSVLKSAKERAEVDKEELQKLIEQATGFSQEFKFDKEQQDRRARNLAAYYMGMLTKARDMVAEQLSSLKFPALPSEAAPKPVSGVPDEDLINPTAGMDTEANVRTHVSKNEKKTKQEIEEALRRTRESMRRSLGGTLGMEIGYAFSDGFAQSIEKALGGGSVGKVIARAFARWMDKEITNLLDNLFDQLAKKKGAAGGAGAGGGGGIFGTILSGLGLGMALGGLFKGFKLKFAEGGIVPGPIGQPQPAIVHSGEVVLNQRQQAALLNGMGGGGMNIHIENAHFASDYDVDRMWDRFNWNMKNRRAVNPGVG